MPGMGVSMVDQADPAQDIRTGLARQRQFDRVRIEVIGPGDMQPDEQRTCQPRFRCVQVRFDGEIQKRRVIISPPACI